MEFTKPYDRNLTISAPAGEKLVSTYSLQVDKNGKKELKESGKTNLYEFIQKALPETLVYNILERFNNGDVNVLDKVHGFYGDVSQMPKTLAEAQQLLIKAEKTFQELPLETRAKYNHSVSEFLSAIESDVKNKQVEEARKALIAEQQAKLAELEAQTIQNETKGDLI